MTLKELAEKFDKYVTIERFTPIEKIVYGATGLILTGAMVTILSYVFIK